MFVLFSLGGLFLPLLESSAALKLHSSSLRLLLVLPLSGCVEVIQNTLHVVEGGPVVRLVLPTGHHDLIELGWAVLGFGHTVTSLHRCHDLSITHACGCDVAELLH